MKNSVITIALILLALTAHAQIIPGHKDIKANLIKPETFQMTWFAKRDTSLVEIGQIKNEVMIKGKKLYIIQQIQMKGQPMWVDSTVADYRTLSAIYHSSYNAQRDMLMNFGKTVTGYYFDKVKNIRTSISEQTQKPYFDSNIYPNLIRALPLSSNYTTTFSIFDYNPNAKIGLLQARIVSVKEGSYHSTKLGKRKVWLVTTTDEISEGSEVTHFIDTETRQVWQQEISFGSRKMLIRRME